LVSLHELVLWIAAADISTALPRATTVRTTAIRILRRTQGTTNADRCVSNTAHEKRAAVGQAAARKDALEMFAKP